ncbi:MAG: hypothetical protein JST18_11720 [Bacteroidetes bacterium]|nr:hypothetical protein [Bacteroidota bacterium]
MQEVFTHEIELESKKVNCVFTSGDTFHKQPLFLHAQIFEPKPYTCDFRFVDGLGWEKVVPVMTIGKDNVIVPIIPEQGIDQIVQFLNDHCVPIP